MNHITHSSGEAQDMQGTHRQLCTQSHGSQPVLLPVCARLRDTHKDKASQTPKSFHCHGTQQKLQKEIQDTPAVPENCVIDGSAQQESKAENNAKAQ